jgi:hypothetical protein
VVRGAARGILSHAAAVVDRAATFAASSARRKKGRAESLNHDQRMDTLGELASLYESEDLEGTFFRDPRAIAPNERLVRWSAGGSRVLDLSWASDYAPFAPGMSERYGRYPENFVAATRLLLGPKPRPVAILIHGYLGGQYALEQRVWPTEWLDRIGLDVALFVLPFHGVRRPPAKSVGEPPPFPGADPRMTNEGFRQAMGDLRDLIHHLLERGHPEVGLVGMSLGGYSTALCATLESRLAFAVPMIPLASVADFARDQGRLGENFEQTRLQHSALDRVHRVVSPFARQPKIPSERVLVIGAKADRITPVEHARRLAHHFGAPFETWHGGHLLQFGRSDSFRRIGRLLDDLRLTTR